MGRIYDGLEDHEGYLMPIGADGAELTGGGPVDDVDNWAVAHRATCSCGWHGPIDDSRPGEDLFDGDDGAGDVLMVPWEEDHIGPLLWRQPLAQAISEARSADSAVVRAVAGARAAGASWTDIGAELGVTKQAAHERFGRRVDELEAAGKRRKGWR
jgi:hypothetical protein